MHALELWKETKNDLANMNGCLQQIYFYLGRLKVWRGEIEGLEGGRLRGWGREE